MSRAALLAILGIFVVSGLSTAPEAWARKSPRESLVDSAMRLAERSLVKPPQDFETCFSPDEPCDAKLVKFIDSAKTSIDVAIYDLTLDEAVHHLLVAARKGIRVRFVVDRKQSKGQHSLVRLLLKANANLRYGRQRGIMHNKFMIVDGRMVQTGSFNYTNGAAFKNNENQIYLANPTVVERYKARFEELWREGKAR